MLLKSLYVLIIHTPILFTTCLVIERSTEPVECVIRPRCTIASRSLWDRIVQGCRLNASTSLKLLLSQNTQITIILFNQRTFLCMAPVLNLLLPFKCISNIFINFIVNKLNRNPPCSMNSTTSALMFFNTFFQINSTARIKRSIIAFKNVHVCHK